MLKLKGRLLKLFDVICGIFSGLLYNNIFVLAIALVFNWQMFLEKEFEKDYPENIALFSYAFTLGLILKYILKV